MAMWLCRAAEQGYCYRCGEGYKKKDIVGVIHVEGVHDIINVVAHPGCWLELGLESLGALPNDLCINAHYTNTYAFHPGEQKSRRLLVRYWQQLNYREKNLKKKYKGKQLLTALSILYHARERIVRKMMEHGGIPISWAKTMSCYNTGGDFATVQDSDNPK